MDEHEAYPLWDHIESILASIDMDSVNDDCDGDDKAKALMQAEVEERIADAVMIWFGCLQYEQDGSHADGEQAWLDMQAAIRAIDRTVSEIAEINAFVAHDPEHGNTPAIAALDVRHAVYDYAHAVGLDVYMSS